MGVIDCNNISTRKRNAIYLLAGQTNKKKNCPRTFFHERPPNSATVQTSKSPTDDRKKWPLSYFLQFPKVPKNDFSERPRILRIPIVMTPGSLSADTVSDSWALMWSLIYLFFYEICRLPPLSAADPKAISKTRVRCHDCQKRDCIFILPPIDW